jgi:hypothetical protein
MSEFKDRLWRELVREHGAELARIDRQAATPGRRVRPRVLAGATLGLVAIGTVVALAAGATQSSPAYAVDRHPDGTVTLTISRLEGIRGANARLAALGVRVRAVPVMAGCVADTRVAKVPVRPGAPAQVPWAVAARAAGSVAIDPRKIHRGETLMVAAKPGRDQRVQLIAPKVVRGEVPACIGPPAGLARRHAITCQTTDGAAVPPPETVPSGPPGTGNSGNSGAGNSGAGNSGTGNSGGITCQIRPLPAGNSGSGNSGDSGTGNSGS